MIHKKQLTSKLQQTTKNNKRQTNFINCGLVNARSINNKIESVIDFILEHKLDMLCITETWVSVDDKFIMLHQMALTLLVLEGLANVVMVLLLL